MPKSRKRGGEKAHRKRIQSTNQAKAAQISTMQKLFNESMRAQIEEMKKQAEAQSANTETNK